jgi:hypothetical protein
VAQTFGTNAVYDVWNEPDHETFFMNWYGATFERFLETFRIAHDAVRSVVPNARISGPSLAASYSPARLTQFMDFCKTNGLTVQVLALHMLDRDDASLDRMEDDLRVIRSNYVDSAEYADVGTEEIHVNEYLGNNNQWLRPGSILAFMRSMEKTGVDAACRSAWINPDNGSNSAFDGSIDGILTGTDHQPRAAWWAYKWYADGAGTRVAAVSDNGSVVPLASATASTNASAQLLIASCGYAGAVQDMSIVTVSLTNLASTGVIPTSATNLLVSVYRVAFSGDGSDTVAAPEQLITNRNVAVSAGTAAFTLMDVNAYDAQLITLSKDNRPPQIQPSSVSIVMSEDGAPTDWVSPQFSATDADGDLLTWSLLLAPTAGVAQVYGTGAVPAVLSYKPNANWSGSDFFDVQVDDGDLSSAVTVTVNVTADTLPEDWENLYGVTLPNADDDRDGYSNQAEYLFGTAPDSAASRFVMQTAYTNLLNGSQGFSISFKTVSVRNYFLERTWQLQVPEWSDVTNFSGNNATAVITDTHLTDHAFYRVRVEVP